MNLAMQTNLAKIGAVPSGKDQIREQNERLILESAEKVFSIYGFEGARTRLIAKEARLPKANIHYYFETKSNLYECVLKNMLRDWMSAARMFKAQDNPSITLTNYISAKMDLARQRPYGSRIWAKEIMSGAPVMEKELATTLKQWVDECVTTINQWVAEKKIVPVDAKALLYMIWATTQHYADFDRQIVVLNDGKALSDPAFKEKKRQVIKLILAGIVLHPDTIIE
ncbi:TetR/AcrR family transcriptional regulator [Candidatus Spongiihabitans sp.]|uniref:TetR/AcrR family transcriptional regulator n=1 Tax=Candidatus Spongiihabitans sp. TaxID=3101308 RepID=UPI003C6FA130